jgi:hypothetical protein
MRVMHRLGMVAAVLGMVIGTHSEVRGTAIHTSGYGSYVEIADSPSVSPTAQMTLEAWVRRASGQSGTVFNKYWGDSGPSGSRSFSFFAINNGGLEIYVSPEGYTISGRLFASETAGLVPDDVWTHVAAVHDGTDLIAYVNGVEVARIASPGGVHDGPLPIRMGCPDGPLGGAGDIQLDEMRIWSVARTPEELQQGMFRSLAGTEPGLGGYWRFDDQDARDYTANGNDGTIVGTVSWVEPGSPSGVSVSAPALTASYLQTITVPVSLADVQDALVSAEVFLSYDGSLLTYDQVITADNLTAGWSVQSNLEDGAGTMKVLKIAAATDNLAIASDGTLLEVEFTVKDVRVPASSPLTLGYVLLNDGDPENVTTDGSVTLVGNTATIETDVAEIIPREPITVTVMDADADVTGGVDQISVEVVNLNNNDTVSLTVDETDVASGQFVETVDTEFGETAEVDDMIQAQHDDVIEFRFVDELDGDGNGPATRTVQVTAQGQTDGSIQVSVVTQPGDLLYIEVTDLDLNTTVGEDEVTVEVTTDGGDSETVILTEADAEDEVFFGQIVTTPGAGVAGELTTAKGVVVTVTYDDVVTASGDQVDQVATSEVVDPFGDVDDNGLIQAYDASLVLQSLLINPPVVLTGLDLLSADVADDFGDIIPLDAAHILKKVVGLLPVFEVQGASSLNHPQGTATPKWGVEERLLSLRVEEGYVSVWVEELSEIVSGEVVVEGVSGRVELGEDLADFLLASGSTEDGVQVLFAGAESVSGPGELLRIYTGVGPGSMRLTRAVFNDGRLVGVGGTVSSVQPEGYVLYGNVPNPFNPETVIRYGLPVESAVVVELFDALGQRVKVLVSGMRSVGDHEVVWDGRDEAGGSVSSGVYFYRLRVGEAFSQMRRMLLLK